MRKGKVQLIDATSFWVPMAKSLGDKRRKVPRDRADEILGLRRAFEEGEHCKIFPTTHFGFRKITVERPLKLNFQASPVRVARLEDERAFKGLAVSKKKAPKAKAKEEAGGRDEQETIRKLLGSLPDKLFRDREEFLKALKIDPAHVDARLYLSLLYADMGELQKACGQLRKILEIDPTHTGAQKILERIEKE